MLLAFSTAQPVRYNRTIVPPWFVTLLVCEKEPESGARTNGPLAEVEKDEKGRRPPQNVVHLCPLLADVGEEPSKTGRGQLWRK